MKTLIIAVAIMATVARGEITVDVQKTATNISGYGNISTNYLTLATSSMACFTPDPYTNIYFFAESCEGWHLYIEGKSVTNVYIIKDGKIIPKGKK